MPKKKDTSLTRHEKFDSITTNTLNFSNIMDVVIKEVKEENFEDSKEFVKAAIRFLQEITGAIKDLELKSNKIQDALTRTEAGDIEALKEIQIPVRLFTEENLRNLIRKRYVVTDLNDTMVKIKGDDPSW